MKIREDNFIHNLKKNNPKALDYIIDSYSGLVNTIVTKALIALEDRGLIEECISDVFISVWENRNKFNGDKINFKSWISAISKYKSIDYFRKHLKDKNTEEFNFNIPDKRDIEEEYISSLEVKKLIDIITSYEEPDKSIFIRKFILGESSSEISRAIGLSINNINTRVFRGRQRIKKDYCNGKEML
ncbi:MAG: sigma-70 family RNA polymerase sigma factor [Clostridium sartagoforme]|nr:sigma-70 family RNA polymerase sigma factor [Clostridium sartagoforme]